ncbi:MAG: membrane protein insertion efficiency factor YidD [Candidatus Marinimicrobia bacterium]|nr:membrane protein insertion efficiency factor YidD [Candidatus Neomarinimicrobiota bacterium]
MTKFLIGLVKLYQLTIGTILPPACRYSPSCSHYMIESIYKYGALGGSIKGLKRIGRCHPWSKHNHWDPVK